MPDIPPAQVETRLEKFVGVCRQKGLKITPQRLEIFRELAATAEHPTAETLHHRIQQRMPTVSLDTVYRTLNTLQEYGLVSKVEVLDDRGRYDANLDRHHHFVCTRCKKVRDLYWPAFDRLEPPVEAEALGRIQHQHAELRGLCPDCQTEKD